LSTPATLLGRYDWRVAATSSATRNLAGRARCLWQAHRFEQLGDCWTGPFVT